jgi:glycosyltransferase involved in cell wall biosynthesis
MGPKVTVLMSVYNGKKYLREAIDSILGQTFTDFEFLIIDDGSTDSSADIIRSYSDPRVRFIRNEKNMGLTRSLNKGIRLATGEYIARQDADDISLPERLEKQVRFLDQNKDVGLVGTYFFMINEAGKTICVWNRLPEGIDLKKILLKGNPFGHGSVMFRAECIEKVGPYREEFKSVQDYDLWLRISEVYDVANIPEPLYKWRFHSKSISASGNIKQAKYASVSIALAKERKQFGKDRLQRATRKEARGSLDDLLPKVETPDGKEIAQSYYFWGTTLLRGKDYRGALKLLWKSFINNPWHRNTWLLVLKASAHLAFPEPVVAALRFIRTRIILTRVLSSQRGADK